TLARCEGYWNSTVYQVCGAWPSPRTIERNPMRSSASLTPWFVMLLWAGACADDASKASDAGAQLVESEGGSDAGTSAREPLLPWKEGDTSTYRVVQDGVYTDTVQTVGPEEPVGIGPNAEKLAFKMTTRKGDSDETVSWQGVVGDAVVRYREQAFGAM